jgi:1-acyl-sn-glycerol-3-phosphate acyltransferase
VTALPGAVPSVGHPRRSGIAGAVRLGLVPAWTAGWYLGWLAAGLLPGAAARRRGVVRRWARGLIRILGLRVVVTGTPPAAPFLLVTNHLSYLDVIALAAVADVVFVAKREVRRWPLFGRSAALIGCIFVDRASPRDAIHAGTAIREAVRAGLGVVLFAEGTSSPGDRVLPLRPALLHWAAREKEPVHAAALSWHSAPGDPSASELLCWWGDMEFLPHLAGVCRAGRGECRIVFGRQPVSAPERGALAARLHATISELFTPSS